MKESILSLRALGFSLSEISKLTGYSISEVCEVVYNQNNEDKYE